MRGPGLLATSSPCRGYFPARATADHGTVRIQVRVDASGHAQQSYLLLESPLAQGFGAAARACAAALRFSPAIDARGIAITGETKLELLFDRS